jgi:hypothetical protein
MWAVWLVTGAAAAAFLGTLATLRTDFRAAARAWKILALSGIPLSLGGLGFAVRFWRPTGGPYLANALYPFGPYLNAWAVSFGFTWLAFGLLFFGLAVTAAREPSRPRWVTLLVTWLLCWLPHVVIGVGFAWAGQNAPSLRVYRDWASDPAGLVVLCTGSVILVSHGACAIVGFITTGREVWHPGPDQHSALDPRAPA